MQDLLWVIRVVEVMLIITSLTMLRIYHEEDRFDEEPKLNSIISIDLTTAVFKGCLAGSVLSLTLSFFVGLWWTVGLFLVGLILVLVIDMVVQFFSNYRYLPPPHGK